MLEKARLCKAKFYTRDESFKPFAGQTMAMIFTKPSARTRVSFETVRTPNTSFMGKGEQLTQGFGWSRGSVMDALGM